MPAEMNKDGLASLAQAEFMAHDFAGARDHAVQLTKLDPNKAYPYQMLGDALLELGAYDDARAAYRRMEQLGGRGISALTRTARVEALYGDTAEARRRFEEALALSLAAEPPDRETIAWCRWQLGETAFMSGDYDAAGRHYDDALTTFPGYYRALASEGKLNAARGDLDGAIASYEQALRIIPDPSYAASLGDLYALSGRERDAKAQYALVEQIAKLNAFNGEVYNRVYALYLADHDLNANVAYDLAAREYEARKDVYGADALAWTAFRAGRLDEARTAVGEALRLGTRDAKILYHAGMIAKATGDAEGARNYLEQALALNHGFDPLQPEIARKPLASL